ncbi:MAG: hypothetical protein HWE25_10915 [Alphaproteobacteria bacterium]|nr:hypothetical protein [Alphaproteobacteria bacterium]
MATGRENAVWTARKGAILIVAFLVSLAILMMVLGKSVSADDSDSASSGQIDTVQREIEPLVVPVYPRLRKKPSDDSKDSEPPKGADLRDSYIIMGDGSVLTMADWIKGSLTKNQTGAGMSDYDTRLFLGQVARALAGRDENQVNRSVVSVGPMRDFKPGGVPRSVVENSLAGLVGLFLVKMPDDYTPATAGGAFDRRLATAGGAAVLFEEQFQGAVAQTADEFRELGTMQNMLNAYKRKAGQ